MGKDSGSPPARREVGGDKKGEGKSSSVPITAELSGEDFKNLLDAQKRRLAWSTGPQTKDGRGETAAAKTDNGSVKGNATIAHNRFPSSSGKRRPASPARKTPRATTKRGATSKSPKKSRPWEGKVAQPAFVKILVGPSQNNPLAAAAEEAAKESRKQVMAKPRPKSAKTPKSGLSGDKQDIQKAVSSRHLQKSSTGGVDEARMAKIKMDRVTSSQKASAKVAVSATTVGMANKIAHKVKSKARQLVADDADEAEEIHGEILVLNDEERRLQRAVADLTAEREQLQKVEEEQRAEEVSLEEGIMALNNYEAFLECKSSGRYGIERETKGKSLRGEFEIIHPPTMVEKQKLKLKKAERLLEKRLYTLEITKELYNERRPKHRLKVDYALIESYRARKQKREERASTMSPSNKLEDKELTARITYEGVVGTKKSLQNDIKVTSAQNKALTAAVHELEVRVALLPQLRAFTYEEAQDEIEELRSKLDDRMERLNFTDHDKLVRKEVQELRRVDKENQSIEAEMKQQQNMFFMEQDRFETLQNQVERLTWEMNELLGVGDGTERPEERKPFAYSRKLYKSEKEAAAAKIQANWRGKKTRQSMNAYEIKKMKASKKKYQIEKERVKQESAATKIQSKFRGRTVRKQYLSTKERMKQEEEERLEREREEEEMRQRKEMEKLERERERLLRERELEEAQRRRELKEKEIDREIAANRRYHRDDKEHQKFVSSITNMQARYRGSQVRKQYSATRKTITRSESARKGLSRSDSKRKEKSPEASWRKDSPKTPERRKKERYGPERYRDVERRIEKKVDTWKEDEDRAAAKLQAFYRGKKTRQQLQSQGVTVYAPPKGQQSYKANYHKSNYDSYDDERRYRESRHEDEDEDPYYREEEWAARNIQSMWRKKHDKSPPRPAQSGSQALPRKKKKNLNLSEVGKKQLPANLHVSIYKGEGLASERTFLVLYPNPNPQRLKYTTNTAKGEDPVWNEEFMFDMEDASKTQLCVEVYESKRSAFRKKETQVATFRIWCGRLATRLHTVTETVESIGADKGDLYFNLTLVPLDLS